MNELTFCELREKDIVNLADGKKLGRVIDLALSCNGRVLGLVAPGERGIIRHGGREALFIPWQNITKIGDDVILVNLTLPGLPLGGH